MNRSILWLGAALLAGLAVGAAWPPPPLSRTTPTTAIWSPPAAASLVRFAAANADRALKDLHWEGDSTGGDPQNAQWRLAGILAEPAPVALVEVVATHQVSRVPIGATLPDGRRLDAIERDRIKVSSGKCVQTYRLYHAEPTSASGDCLPQEVGAQQGKQGQ